MKIWTFSFLKHLKTQHPSPHPFPGATLIRSGTRVPLESLSLLFLRGDLMRPEICYYKSPYHVEHSYSKERKYLQGMEMKHLYFYLPFRIKKKSIRCSTDGVVRKLAFSLLLLGWLLIDMRYSLPGICGESQHISTGMHLCLNYSSKTASTP